MKAQDIIDYLQLVPHPEEGGFFRETYRAKEHMAASSLPDRYGSATGRDFGTAIYYLLTPGTFSHLHRLRSDEIFHFYLGGPVRMLQLAPDSTGRTMTLGPDLTAGQKPQLLVPNNVWQGAYLLEGDFALLGCTVAPGFEFADYEHADRATLLARYPDHASDIRRLTHA